MENFVLVVRKSSLSTVVVVLIAISLGCGGGGINGDGDTQVAGSWTITVSSTTYPDSVFHITLVPGPPCTITTPVGNYGNDLPDCFVAGTGQGSISGSGYFFYQPKKVVVNSYSSVQTGNPLGFNVVFLEGDPYDTSGNFAVFAGSGEISGGKMNGTWLCATGPCEVDTPEGGVAILGGTFVGHK